ncbi:hypothetical protein EDB84DRAFT_1398499 [Lactarius hengduanensis]|nr:hypothetical protein EDB84DRAFT_1398499 [Lactarius hengduanensis]
MVGFREIVFIKHPNIVFPILSAELAVVALSPTPTFIPLVLLVATLLVYTRITVPRPHGPRTIFWAVMSVSFASTLSHIMPSVDALSSTASSIASLWLISSLSSSMAFFSTILADRLSPRLSIPWARFTFFPAIWATVWQMVSHASPVGHLVTWTPVAGFAGYEWTRPLLGTWGINWLVGAYAIVIAELVGVWFIGPVEEFEQHDPLIPSIGSNSEPRSIKPATLQSHHTLFLSAALLALTAPSFFSPALPILPWSMSSTPLSIGCVLPHPSLPGDGSSPLDRFIAESQHLTGARILLWPEGALRFETSVQRDDALKRVQEEIKGPLVGVTFTEPVPHDAGWGHAREGKWRNGLVLVGPDGPVAEFYKRNLVPIAESFSLTESRREPELYELELHGTKKNKKWTPAPPYERTIPLTAAICLDFSSPSIFSSLESRPALILAPAQTWHRDVSIAMWEQARARAEETGSMVLFCDGGAQGASGVAGQGMREPSQFGSGSWMRFVGVQWPFNQRRTPYMWGGGALPATIVWSLLGAGWAAQALTLRLTRRASGGTGTTVTTRLRDVFDRVRARIGRRGQGERQPLLL